MLTNYLKLALKVLARRPFFTFVSLFGISFTLAVLVTATAVLDHAFGPLAPEVHRERTLFLDYLILEGERSQRSGSPGWVFLERYVRDLPGVEEMSVYSEPRRVFAYQTGEKSGLQLKRTDAAYWRILAFDFLEGGPLAEADVDGGAPVAVINETTRDRLFPDGTALDREVLVEGQAFRVVGVVADVSQLRTEPYADLWVPLTATKTSQWMEEFHGDLHAMLLAESREAFGPLRAELAARLAAADVPQPERFDRMLAYALEPFEIASREIVGSDDDGRPATRELQALLVGALLLFLLLPSVNLINVNTSRILERAPEIGVRKAFGASCHDLLGQFLLENLVLTLVGGALGLLLSVFAVEAVAATGWIRYADLQVNLRVFAWGVCFMVLFALLSGLYPAWRMARLDPADILRGRSL